MMFYRKLFGRCPVIAACVACGFSCVWMIGCGSANTGGSAEVAGDESAAGSVRLVEEAWPNGQRRLRKQVLMETDGTTVDHGKYRKWHDNGNKSYEATFVRGKAEGTVTRWHKNGEVWMVQNYRDGLKHGLCTSYDEKGHKRKEERYHHDEPHGTWRIWKGSGKLKWQASFSHGVPLADDDKTPQEL